MDTQTVGTIAAAGQAGPQALYRSAKVDFSVLFPNLVDLFDAPTQERMVAIAEQAFSEIQGLDNADCCKVEKLGVRGGVFWVLPRLELAPETISRIISDTGVDQSQVRTSVSKVRLADGKLASLVFASAVGLEDGHLQDIKSELDAAAPYLVRSVLDYKGPYGVGQQPTSKTPPATVQMIQEARLKIGECPPDDRRPLDENAHISEFLAWLQKKGFIFHGARSRLVTDGQNWNETGILGIKGTASESIKTQLDALRDSRPPSGSSLACRRLPVQSPIHEARPLVALALRVQGEHEVREYEFVGLWSTQAIVAPNIDRRILNNVKFELDKELAPLHEASPNARLVTDRVFNTMPKDLVLRLGLDELAEIMESSFLASSKQTTSIKFIEDPLSSGLVVCLCLPGQRDESNLQRNIRGFLAKQFDVDPLLCEIRGTGNEGQITNFYVYVPTLNRPEPLDAEYVGLLDFQLRQLSMSWNEKFLALAERHGVEGSLAQLWSPVLHPAYQQLDPLKAVSHVKTLDAVAQDGNVRVCFDDSQNMSVFFRDEVPDDASLSEVFKRFGLSTTSIATYTHGPIQSNGSGTHNVVERQFSIKIPKDSGKPLEWLNKDLTQALEKALSNKIISDNLDSLMLSAGISAEQVQVMRAFAMFRNSIDRYQARGVGKRIFSNGYNEIVEAVTRNPWAVDHFFKMFHALHSSDSTDPDATFARLRKEFNSAQIQHKVRQKDKVALNALVDMQDAVVRTNFYSPFRDGGDIALGFNARKITQMHAQSPFLARMDVVIGEDYIACHDREGLPTETDIMIPARGGMRLLDLSSGDFGELHDLCIDQGDKNLIWRIPEVGGKSMALIHGFLDPMKPDADKKASLAQRSRIACAFMNALWDITDNLDENMQPVACPGIRRRDGVLDLIREMGPDMNSADLADDIHLEAIRRGRWEGSACMSSSVKAGFPHPETGVTSGAAEKSQMINLRARGWNPAREEGGTSIYFTFNGGPNGDVTGNSVEIVCERTPGGKIVSAANKDWVILDPDGLDRDELMRLKREGKDWGDFGPEKLGLFGILSARENTNVDITVDQRNRLRLPQEAPVSGEELILHCNSNSIGNIAADGSDREGIPVFSTGGRTYYIIGRNETAESIGEGYNSGCWVTSDQAAKAFKVFTQVANRQITDQAALELALLGASIRRGAGVNGGGVNLSSAEVQKEKIPLEWALRSGKINSRDELIHRLKSHQDYHLDRTMQVAYENEYLLKSGIASLMRRTDLAITVIEELVEKGILIPTAHLFPTPAELKQRQAKGQSLTEYELDFLVPALARLVMQEIHKKPELIKSEVLTPHYLEEFHPETRENYREEILNNPFNDFNIAAELTYEVVANLGFTGLHKLQRDYDVSLLSAIQSAIAAEMILGTRQLRRAIYESDVKAKFGLTHDEVKDDFTSMSVAHEQLSALLVRFHEPDGLNDIKKLKDQFEELLESPEEVLVDDELVRFRADCEACIGRGMKKEDAERLSMLRFTEDLFDIMHIMRESHRSLRETVHAFSIIRSKVGLKKLTEFLNKTEPNDANEAQDLQKAHDKLRKVLVTQTLGVLRGTAKPEKDAEPSEAWLSVIRSRVDASKPIDAARQCLADLEGAHNSLLKRVLDLEAKVKEVR